MFKTKHKQNKMETNYPCNAPYMEKTTYSPTLKIHFFATPNNSQKWVMSEFVINREGRVAN